ncbi:MAG: 16S rRNA (uracil(1498)-N(3))-methyltransferase [Bdellovibrionaceae bacterium]|nr:16S rRNA (uracil(1498)-N(3))-methyltransferase [Pseudobdellovibrionaceae bacterium]
MRRYWIEGISETQTTVEISGDDYHHIIDVCRQAPGSRFEVLTQSGYALFVELTHVLRRSALAQVLSQRKIEELKKPYIHMALSLPKLATFEAVLEKSVELGVCKVWPFLSEYSFFKSQKKIMEEKAPRFQKIIKGATQQSGRASLMEMAPATDLDGILKAYAGTASPRGIFAYEGEGGKPLKSVFDPTAGAVENIWLFVGSEGGFSHAEVERFKNVNLFPVSLGHQVLRVETACVTLLGVIKYEMNLF